MPVFISTVAHFNPQIKLDRMRGLAVLGAERTAFAPDYPDGEVNKALEQPAMREKLITGFYEPLGGTPERFADVIAADIARMGKVIRELGITSD